jgi:TonB family protein
MMNNANTTLLLLCAFLYAAAVCGAQEPAPAGIHGIGGPVTPPRIAFKVEPEYSPEARQAGLEGAVLLRIVVAADGKPQDLKVLRTLGLGLDEKAIAAVSNWQFQPGAKDGQPVNVQAQIEVNFRLIGAKWHLARIEFHLADGSVRPIIEKAVAPRVANDALSATATATFDISEKGEAVDVHVDKTLEDEWGRDVTDTLTKWKFTPASKNGKPVSVSCTMDFVRGG